VNKALIATLGFDADLILRRIRFGRGYLKIKCISLRVDEQSFKRVETAYSTIKFIAEKLGMASELRSFSLTRGLIRSIIEEIENEAAYSEVEILLSGGPRLLVIATFIATLLIDPLFIDRVTIIVEGEGFEGEIRAPASWLKKIIELSGDEIEILNYVAGVERVKPSDLVRDLRIPKATAYKKLRKLAKHNILREEDNVFIVSEHLLSILY